MTTKNLMRKEATSAAGFTLIELMIVIAIIGILAAVAIPNFLKARERAQFSQCLETLNGLKVAEEMYITDNNIYTANLKELAMYMIPGCNDPLGVVSPCDNLAKRIDAVGTGNCRSTPIVGITLTASSFSYQIKGNSLDRSNANTGCPICVTPNGYLPAKFASCEGASMTCP